MDQLKHRQLVKKLVYCCSYTSRHTTHSPPCRLRFEDAAVSGTTCGQTNLTRSAIKQGKAALQLRSTCLELWGGGATVFITVTTNGSVHALITQFANAYFNIILTFTY